MKSLPLLAFLSLVLSCAAFSSDSQDSKPLSMVMDMVHHNPGEAPFVTKYTDPNWLKANGYNGQVIKTFPQCAITWDAFDPALLPPGSTERAWSEELGRSIDEKIEAAHKAGIQAFIFTDMLVVPKSLYAKYGEKMTVPDNVPHAPQQHKAPTHASKSTSIAEAGTLKGSGRSFSILKPTTQDVVREEVDEIFKRFPSLDGIVLRFGETYLQDTPYHTGGSPASSVEEHQALLRLLREEICVKRNKKLIYRTWSFGNGFHNNPGFYLRATDAIEPHENLVFSIKHTQGDYTRDRPFNPTLGIGKHPQIIEVSANQAGLYGKCAWPYYCGKGVIDGWDNFGTQKKGISSLAGNPRIIGLWTWSQGDGWFGPYKNHEFWTDINTAVMRAYAAHPGRSEKEIFDEYCRETLHLDERQTRVLRELLLLATNATYHGQESNLLGEGASKPGGTFQVNSWWCRDDFLSAVNVDAIVKAGLASKALAEKTQAVEDFCRVEQLAKDLRLSDKDQQEFVEVSSTYGRIRIAICREIWAMQLLAAQGRESGRMDWGAMKEAIARYDALWQSWRTLKAEHACCPTLYRDNEAVHCGPPFAEVLAQYRQEKLP